MNFLSQLSRSMQLQSSLMKANEGIIDLAALRSPYPPSPKVGEALSKVDYTKLNEYPDLEEKSLKTTIADKFKLEIDNVFLHNSTDDILSLAFRAFFDPNDKVAFPDITSFFYAKCAKVNNVNYEKISVTQDMKIHLEDYKDLDCKGIILSNPNIPTGYSVNKIELVELIKNNPEKLFIIDERFVEYSNTSIVNNVNDLDNVVILRSFAYAYGLTGIRCGYALACRELIKGLKSIHECITRFPLDSITQCAAEACIKDNEYLMDSIDKVITTREDVSDKLRKLNFEVLPSSTNFIFCKHDTMTASELEFLLREQGIIVKQYKLKKIDNYLRISMGLPEEMDKLIKCLKKVIK